MAHFSPDYLIPVFPLSPASSTTMDADTDSFLNGLELASLASVGGQSDDGGLENGARGGGSAVYGSRSGAPIESFGDFDLTIGQQPCMDLSDYNLFGDKASDGRREDNGMNQSAGSSQGSSGNINFDALQQLLSMQMQMQQQQQYPMSVDNSPSAQAGPSNGNNNPTVLLEQQLRLNQLQQLQQLQNQIFQQQIELISGQNSMSSSLESTPLSSNFRDSNQFQGLPTPANSTELRPQPPPNFVSPMILQNYLSQPGSALAHFANPHPNPIPQGPSSAPAHLAFNTQTPLLSPGGLDFELSPLTSPWLGAVPYQQAQGQHQHQQHQHQQSQQQSQQSQSQSQQHSQHQKRRGSKRGASSSGDDGAGQVQTKKRQSPAIRATIGGGGGAGSRRASVGARGTASLSSTPAIRARSGRNSVMGEVVGDTPSPVDLSMPPPAPPSQANVSSASAQSNATSSSTSSTSPALAPVTPASIMNLGNLGLRSGLSPPLSAVEEHQSFNPGLGGTSTSTSNNQSQNQPKGKSTKNKPPKITTSASAAPASKTLTKKASATSLISASPSLKPLLPGGLAPSSALQLGSASNYSHQISGSAAALNIAPATPLPPPAPAMRKASHKDAEQKRRNSLKTSFDALRLLLPPLPLPNDENYQGEAPLPGSMPPRGPPRGDVAGPNRAVSKLQLLRCGNDFIRRLQGRVTRRDEYIEQLKAEIRALRARVEKGESEEGIEDVTAEFEKVDLERDIDIEEENAPRLGGAIMEGDEADEEYE